MLLVALLWGELPAGLFHDYAGTILVIIWLVVFWELSYCYLLHPTGKTNVEDRMETSVETNSH
jgi:hypothetical protein